MGCKTLMILSQLFFGVCCQEFMTITKRHLDRDAYIGEARKNSIDKITSFTLII